ncbi:MAG: glycerol-3-phosphate dehydrogenase [Alphaproteobacteria bacterium]|nr:glycerol-3-phosphate dehydrogenase [Alphaproteobacteria bacterium]
MTGDVDLLVVGGGVNGVGVARDAAGRGLSVVLVEAQDLAGATSSASSKLVHGGLRYLEQYEFRLVRESLIEREVLLAAAPHVIWPLRFVLPHHDGLRPAWMLRAGLFLYDHLGPRRQLKAAEGLDLRHTPQGAPLQTAYRRGFAYSDCWVDDARLVALTARDAAERGADIRTRTRLASATKTGRVWTATLEGDRGGAIRARAIVNAAGPWVADVLRAAGSARANRTPRLVKGSHIVTRRLYEGEHAYTFQAADGRVVFAIPYEGRFTLIGTTDVPYSDDPRRVTISDDEIAYLCEVASGYFATPVTAADVVWTYAGVRPLYDDGESDASAVTRDYVFDLEGGGEAPVLLSIYGGKLTTFRKLAEHALRDLAKVMDVPGRPWTAGAPLPGGDIADGDFEAFVREMQTQRPGLPAPLVRRLARAYGTRMDAIAAEDSRDLGGGLTEAEVDYLVREEWARTADDVLWRRSKLGLHLDADAQARVRTYMGG